MEKDNLYQGEVLIKGYLSKMTKKNTYAFIMLILLLSGCSRVNENTFEKTKLYVKFYQTPGLTTNSILTQKGLLIGKVSKLQIHNDSVLIELTLDSGVQIPRGSAFLFYSVDLLGTKGIKVETSNQNTFFSSKETITGKHQENVPFNDAISNLSEADIKKIRKNISLLLNLSEAEMDTIVHRFINGKGKLSSDSIHQLLFRKRE